jgi:two-component system alkaline phosphatase synthesis response regulator PhoP
MADLRETILYFCKRMSANHRILLVEDEDHLRQAVRLNLEAEDYTVSDAADGKTALKIFREERFHLIILDAMLPDIDGFTLCETIRLTNREVPVLFLTARDSGEDRVAGLKKGADDYLTKPFNLEELLLRIRKLIQRSARGADMQMGDVFRFGNNEINFSTYEITADAGEKKLLTKKEIMLLRLLVDRKNEVVSRETILESVWGYDIYPSTRTVDNFIVSFRKYFEKDPRNPKHFHSVRGVGYRFTE